MAQPEIGRHVAFYHRAALRPGAVVEYALVDSAPADYPMELGLAKRLARQFSNIGCAMMAEMVEIWREMLGGEIHP